eukprot:10647822-Karenia_brevis.AAC.1
MEQLLAEIGLEHWDAVIINETWRGEREEFDTIRFGLNKYVWLGSGGTPGKHGVGILLHSRWSSHVKGWSAVNERVGYLDIQRQRFRLRLVA